jgi:anhydro-N-acetylmuramic acid kinase
MSIKFNAIGLMSGTSFDGIDVSIISTDGVNVYKIYQEFYFPFNKNFQIKLKKFKEKINFLNNKKNVKSSKEFKELSHECTAYHISAVKKILLTFKKKIDVIGFHGITVLHKPQKKFTLQLGEPQLIKKKFNCKVVFNFRDNDLLNGGEGAPLTPVYHQALCKKFKSDKPFFFINIGGISNLTYIFNKKIHAFDIGPGNCLLDSWIDYFDRYSKNDLNGSISKKGKVNISMVNSFIDKLDYLKKKKISFDTSDFSLSEFRGLDLFDGAATLAFLTGKIIANAINELNYKNKFADVYIAGGGRKNLSIIKSIQENCVQKINLIDAKNINGDFIESQAFAYLATRCVKNLPITFPSTTGVKKKISGGVIY